jgi:beta-lactamase class A
LVLVGLIVGLTSFLLFRTPEPIPEAAPSVGDVQPGSTLAAAVPSSAEGVPVQATEVAMAPSAPTPDPRLVNEQKLREAVFAPFRGVTGRFGIVVKDLSTGQSVRLNDNFPFQAASLYKLTVMYEVFKQRDLDMFSLSEEMTIGPDDVAMDLGSLPWPVGTRITIGTALDRMVTISDNSGAYMLAKKVGTPRINEDMLSLGLMNTHIRGGDLQTSAADMARLLEIIARGEALSPETSAEMVHLMARQQVRDRIPVMLPPEATIANKTGNWEAAAHDVAIVYGPRSTFVIALLSDGIDDVDGLYTAMSTSARNIYDLVNDPTFGSSASPALPRSQVASYQVPVKVPGGAASSSGSGSASSGSGSSAGTTPPRVTLPIVPAPTPVPADRPRQPAPTQAAPAAPAQAAPKPSTNAPAPTTGGPALAPQPGAGQAPAVPKPAEKPAEKPVAPASTPAIKPMAPSIFTIPAPTKTP